MYRGESSLWWRENLLSKKLLWLAGWWLLRTDGANIFISKLESGWADITWVASQIFHWLSSLLSNGSQSGLFILTGRWPPPVSLPVSNRIGEALEEYFVCRAKGQGEGGVGRDRRTDRCPRGFLYSGSHWLLSFTGGEFDKVEQQSTHFIFHYWNN